MSLPPLHRKDWENTTDPSESHHTPTKSFLLLPQDREEMVESSAVSIMTVVDDVITHIPKGIYPDFGNAGVKAGLLRFLEGHLSCAKMTNKQLEALANDLTSLFKEKFKGKREGALHFIHYLQDIMRGWYEANCG